MKREELFEVIGEVDETLLKRSESVKRKNVWVKLGTSAACALLAVAIAVPFFGGKGERIPLPNTTDAIKVYEMKKLPSQMTAPIFPPISSGSLVRLLTTPYPTPAATLSRYLAGEGENYPLVARRG